MTEQQNNNVKRKSIAQLWKDGEVSAISKLRYNKLNNYPFLTFIKNGKAANLYFSKSTAKVIEEQGFLENQDLIDNKFILLGDIVEVQNANGDTRFKISVGNEQSEYSSVSNLESAFGVQNTDNQFNIELFRNEYKSAADNAVKIDSTQEATA